MVTEYRRYIATETTISVVINIIISALFMFLIFGRAGRIELWGVPGLAVDFVPQTFMIAAMSVVVPTWQTRKRLSAGRVAHRPSSTGLLPRNLAMRALLIALSLTLLLGGGAVMLLSQQLSGPETFWHVFPFKLAYGGFVALLATPIGLSTAIAEPARKPRSRFSARNQSPRA